MEIKDNLITFKSIEDFKSFMTVIEDNELSLISPITFYVNEQTFFMDCDWDKNIEAYALIDQKTDECIKTFDRLDDLFNFDFSGKTMLNNIRCFTFEN